MPPQLPARRLWLVTPGGDCETSLAVHLEPRMLCEAPADSTVWSLYLEVYSQYVRNDASVRLAMQWAPGAAVCIRVKSRTLMNRKFQCCLRAVTKAIVIGMVISGADGVVCVAAVKEKRFNVI